MKSARIFQPTKSAMQSGEANTRGWVLQFESGHKHPVEPLMGWTTCQDTSDQVILRFPTKEEAIAYAEKNGVQYSVAERPEKRHKVRLYADNFRYDRPEPWTH